MFAFAMITGVKQGWLDAAKMFATARSSLLLRPTAIMTSLTS